MLLVFIIIVIIIIINNNNAMRRKEKYLNLIKEMSRNYRCVKFVKISPCQLPWRFLRWMLHVLRHDEIGIDKKQQLCIIKKMIYIAIRATYYIFCCRNRNWDSPDFVQFWFFFCCCCFVFVLVFNFLIIQSQAAFVNCLYVARFTIVHSKTQIKFPLFFCPFFVSGNKKISIIMLILPWS